MYDIIFIGNNDDSFLKLKERFPTAKRVVIKKDIQTAFNEAQKKSFTKMFWVVWDDIDIIPEFKFDYKVPDWDNQYIHLFLNGSQYDGIGLFPKTISISKNELSCRFFINTKEINVLASTPKKYDVYNINTYDDYLSALTTAESEMFWIVFNDIIIDKNFKFDLYFSHHNQYDRKTNHMFLNGQYHDGVILASKNKVISKREFDYRFLADKKEWDILASVPKPFDVVFISYFEKFADSNFQKLLDRVGNTHNIYRINGIKGIHNAHRAAAEVVKTDMFWVVDADAIIEEDFSFNYQIAKFDANARRTVYVWRSRNPINNLEYGYGGVKLLPSKLTLNMDMSKPDMTTSISVSFKAMPSVSNVSEFNTDPFTTWRSAFRECVKLASKTIRGQVDSETDDRLNVWCTVGADKLYGQYAISGAIAGRNYGQENAGNIPALSAINDYDWLKEQFERTR